MGGWRFAGAALLVIASSCGGTPAPTARREAVLQLGRPICGDCCVEQVQRAFDGLSGVAAVHMSPGDLDFTVELTSQAPAPEVLIARLVEAGAPQARLGPAGSEAAPRKQWVTAR